MRRIIYIGLLMLLLTGCNSKTYKTISATEAKNMMNENTIILDVRTPAEYEINHIKDAINIPLDEIDETVASQLKDKKQTILVYCQSGNRSKQASQKLVDLGYTSIYNFGGITNWNYETTSPKKDSTKVLLQQIISSIKIVYLEEVIEGGSNSLFEVVCDGKTCIYGDNKTLPLTEKMIPTGTIKLGSDGAIQSNDLLINGYNCSISSNETIHCD